MSTLRNALVVGLLTIGAAGCASVNSTMPSTNTVTGEAWYGENTSFLGLTFSSRVWYCPAATSPGPITCVEAKMVGEGEASADTSAPAPKAAKPKPKSDDDQSDDDARPPKHKSDDADEDAKPKKKKNVDDSDEEDNKPKKKKSQTN